MLYFDFEGRTYDVEENTARIRVPSPVKGLYAGLEHHHEYRRDRSRIPQHERAGTVPEPGETVDLYDGVTYEPAGTLLVRRYVRLSKSEVPKRGTAEILWL